MLYTLTNENANIHFTISKDHEKDFKENMLEIILSKDSPFNFLNDSIELINNGSYDIPNISLIEDSNGSFDFENSNLS